MLGPTSTLVQYLLKTARLFGFFFQSGLLPLHTAVVCDPISLPTLVAAIVGKEIASSPAAGSSSREEERELRVMTGR